MIRRLLVGLLGLGLTAGSLRLPEVREHTLRNGVRVLLVEQPGSGAVHVELLAARLSPDPLGAPAAAYDMLRRCLGAPEPTSRDLEALLAREDGLWASLHGGGRTAGVDLSELEALHQKARAALEALEIPTPVDQRQVASRMDGDGLALGWDMPTGALSAWSRRLSGVLRDPVLAAFPLQRDRWMASLEAQDPSAWPWPRYYATLLPAALGGSQYATGCTCSIETVASLRYQHLRHLAKSLLTPDRLILVLVGDVGGDATLQLLQTTFGTLPESLPATSLAWDPPEGTKGDWSGRRIQVTTDGDTRVLLALRVPPALRPDDSVPLTFAEILAGGPTSRLWLRLVEQSRVARKVTAHLDVPGGRNTHLLVLDAEPATGHSLIEVEQVLQSELTRILNEGPQEDELREAQGRLEAAQALLQDDATSLAQALGLALVRVGDWRGAFPHLSQVAPLTTEEFHSRIRRTWEAGSSLTLLLEPDVLVTPQDSSEVQLVRQLTRMLSRTVTDSATLDAIVRQTVLQMRLLTPAERTRTLALLEGKAP